MKFEDLSARRRFCQEIDKNFSVIAPAGVGKTSAIVERIVETGFKDFRLLRSLCVVTYTRKAAEEMFSRTLKQFEAKKAPKYAFDALSQGFFGTIHSFCFSLLKTYGTVLGLSPLLEIVEDDSALRAAFLRDHENIYRYVSPTYFHEVLRYLDFEDFFRLVLSVIPNERINQDLPIPPEINGGEVLNFIGNARNAQSIQEGKALFVAWNEKQRSKTFFNPIPYFQKGGKEFQEVWVKTFAPVRQWMQENLSPCLQAVAEAYLQFRIKQGKLLHSDTILLARRLFHLDPTRTVLQQDTLNILLDEAQDTDADQFNFLLAYFKLNTRNRFSMVGDPQQSIYGSRTSVQNYLNWHKRLSQERLLEPLIFSTTFRCPQKVVEAVNHCFTTLLDEKKEYQVPFVSLQTPKEAPRGEVIKLKLKLPGKELDPDTKIATETAALADWLKAESFEPSHVAFLSPRNQWLLELKHGFEAKGMKLQLHSSTITWREKPFYAWLYVLIHLFAYPDDAFELVGVLREWFGISDRAIVDFVYDGGPKPVRALQILKFFDEEGEVVSVLNFLHEIRKTSLNLPFYSAVSKSVKELGLVERLLQLNQTTLEEVENIWDWITWQFALCYCEEGQNWQKLDQRLKIFLDRPVQNFENEDRDAYQGYTLHKAKGLEWPIVILPFFFRSFDPNMFRYPYIFENRVIFDDLSSEKILAAAYRKAEFERLLYVGFTRAKGTLICVDDSDFWEEKFSLGKLFLQGEKNLSFWQKMPITEL